MHASWEQVQRNSTRCLHEFPVASIVLAGDFNQLADGDVTEKTGLLQIVRHPTRGPNILDRIYTSQPVYSLSLIHI